MSVDAIVVLGCRIAPDGQPVGPSLRRALAALGSYRQGVAPWVVASGGKRWHGVAEAEAYRAMLVAGKIPEQRVLMELASMTTRQNALYVAELFRSRGWSRAAVVTCDWHMMRAVRCFADAGIESVPVPVRAPLRSPAFRMYRKLKELTSYYADRGLRLAR